MTGELSERDGSGYFLYHSIGMFPDKARLISEALEEFSQIWGMPDDAQWSQTLLIRQKFINSWQTLINASPGTLTTAENVTTALYSLIGSLPDHYRKRRRLLVAADCFPSLHFLLAGMAERHGFVLDTVPLRPGERWVRDEDFIDRWQEDVGIALLTMVTSTASHRCDLSMLVDHGRRMGTLIGVDVTQGIGLLPFDVESPRVDFTVSTTLKWLCGTPGAGILQVAEEVLRECRPELRGWFSQENVLSWDLHSFAYAPDARRFDHGTPSILACVGSLPALDWYLKQGKANLLRHNRQLSGAIIEAASQLNLSLASPRDDARRGGSVMIELPVELNSGMIIEGLREAGVYADCRGGALRLSPGCMTTMQGVDLLVETLGDHCEAGG